MWAKAKMNNVILFPQSTEKKQNKDFIFVQAEHNNRLIIAMS